MKMIYSAGRATNPTGLICSLHLKNYILSQKNKEHNIHVFFYYVMSHHRYQRVLHGTSSIVSKASCQNAT